LGNNVFDFGTRGAADQVKTSYKALTQHLGTMYGPDIANELENRRILTIPMPVHSQATLNDHIAATARRDAQHIKLTTARRRKHTALRTKAAQDNTDAIMDLANLEIEMEEADRLATLPLKVQPEGNERTMHNNAWKTYQERDSKLQLCRGKAF
jgi:hypothetical protein